MQKVFSKTKFGQNVPIIPVSAIENEEFYIEKLIDCLLDQIEIPKRNKEGPFYFLIDHCFPIKGKGSVVTGTVI